MDTGYIIYAALAVFFTLFIFFRLFRNFVLRALSGVLALFIASYCGLGITLSAFGVILSLLLGVPGAISYFALSYII